MERVVLRVAAETGEITLWSHSEGITTNLIESSSPWKRIAGKAIKIKFNHWQELWKLLGKGVFTIPKKGDELRPIINLKPLNHFVEYHHFKVEGLTLLVLIRPNDHMITMDLKDAFLSGPIHTDHSKYLPFWMGIRAMGIHLSAVWAVVVPSSIY